MRWMWRIRLCMMRETAYVRDGSWRNLSGWSIRSVASRCCREGGQQWRHQHAADSEIDAFASASSLPLSHACSSKEDIVCKTRRLIQIHVRIRIASPPYIYNIRVRKLTCALRLAPVKDPKEFCTLNIFRVSNGLLRSPTASSKRSSKFRGRCWILYM
jgi:hypothetical protein